MCECSSDVKIQEYKNQITLEYNDKYISVDKCLEDEIKHLWSLGIETTGCCYGS